MGRSPYWEAFKFAFAVGGGVAAAATLAKVGYKLAKRGAETLAEARPVPAPSNDDEEMEGEAEAES